MKWCNQQHSRQAAAESDLEVAEQPSHMRSSVTNPELEALRQEQLRIQDERQRPSRIQALDEEARRVRQRIEQISGGTGT
jgi:hypothetical protein